MIHQLHISILLHQHNSATILLDTGTVVLMEKDADVKLVDHTRKNLPSDTYGIQNSFTH
jgi:hypothetical protein